MVEGVVEDVSNERRRIWDVAQLICCEVRAGTV